MTTYAEFVAQLDATLAARTGLDYDIVGLSALQPADRTRAEAELLRRTEAGDTFAFEPVGRLKLAAAVPALERHRDHGGAWPRAAAARALFHLRGDPIATDDQPGDVLRGLDAFALRQSDRPEAVGLLLGLLTDDGLVTRSHAVDGLVEKLGLQAAAAPRGAPLHRLAMALSSRLASVWQPAAIDLQVLLPAARQGIPLAALDLEYAPSRDPTLLPALVATMPTDRPFDLAGIGAMGRHDRAWAETAIVAGLCFGEQRSLDAVRALGVAGWRDHVAGALAL
ncbi:MAG: hypothetical protein EXR79_17495, partial [Myxococcales bacterium]|nr:hypothetical protein [Myxococcales bacterium]